MIVMALALLLAIPAVAAAGGFNIYEMGGRATALGGAFTATADDPSAIFYNPAGTAFLPRGWAVSLNIAPVMPTNKYAQPIGLTADQFPGDATGETERSVYWPAGAYVTYRHDETWSGGFGFFTPFGLGVKWDDPETFAGRPEATNSQIRGYYFSPVATWRPVPGLAVSAGANFVKTSLTLENVATQNFGSDNALYNVTNVELEGTGNWTASAAAAVLWQATDRFSFGANYKGGVTNEFENDDANFTQIPTGQSALDDVVAANVLALNGMDVSGELEYPAIVSAGTRYQATEDLALMLDFVWFDWSAFREVRLEFTSATDTSVTVLREDYTDGQQWRFGTEYRITPSLRGMAGFVYDNSPQPTGSVSPILPDANRFDYSLGLTYAAGNFELTAAYMLVEFESRSTIAGGVGQNYTGFDGDYDANVHIPSLGATYYF